jgi:hypothetical protein
LKRHFAVKRLVLHTWRREAPFIGGEPRAETLMHVQCDQCEKAQCHGDGEKQNTTVSFLGLRALVARDDFVFTHDKPPGKGDLIAEADRRAPSL